MMDILLIHIVLLIILVLDDRAVVSNKRGKFNSLYVKLYLQV